MWISRRQPAADCDATRLEVGCLVIGQSPPAPGRTAQRSRRTRRLPFELRCARARSTRWPVDSSMPSRAQRDAATKPILTAASRLAVVQWIEQGPPKTQMQVRFLPAGLLSASDGSPSARGRSTQAHAHAAATRARTGGASSRRVHHVVCEKDHPWKHVPGVATAGCVYWMRAIGADDE